MSIQPTSTKQAARMLAEHPIFADLRASEIQDLAFQCDIVELQPGERLFVEGCFATEMYIVLAGQLRMTCASPDGVEVVVGTVGNGRILGEMSALDPAPRSATATAINRATLLVLPGQVLTALVESGHPAAHSLLMWIRKQVCSRLRELDARIDAVFDTPTLERPLRTRVTGLWTVLSRQERS